MRNTIKERRAALGLSQVQLAQALGVSRQTINSLECGRYDPSLPLAFSLGRFFECPIEELFDDQAC